MSDKIPSIHVSDDHSSYAIHSDDAASSTVTANDKSTVPLTPDAKDTPPTKQYSKSGEVLPDVAAKWGYTPKDKGPFAPKEPHGYSEEEAEAMRKKGVNPDLKWEMEKENRKGNRGFWAKLAQTWQGGGAIK